MGHPSKEAARQYAREYRLRVKVGQLVPVPAAVRRSRASVACDHCGTKFYRPFANRSSRGTGQYCSRRCMAAAFAGRESPRRGERPVRPCEQCGTEHSRPAWTYRYNSRVFCDRKCFAAWKAAHWCGEDNPAWRGGFPGYRGPNWVRQAREARARDNHHCRFCDTTAEVVGRKLDVHHIRPFRCFDPAEYRTANRLSNLVTLCPTCHAFLETVSESGDVTDWVTLRALAQTAQQHRRQTGRSCPTPSIDPDTPPEG